MSRGATESRDEVLLLTLMFTAVLFCERRRATIRRQSGPFLSTLGGMLAESPRYDNVFDAARNVHDHLMDEELQELGGTLAQDIEHSQPAVAVQAVRCPNIFDRIATFWLPLLAAAVPCAVRRYMADQL